MNIANIVLSLQQAANTSSSIDILILSKAIEKLQAGSILAVSNTSSLPSDFNAIADGALYYVESEEEFYYKKTSSWLRLSPVEQLSFYAWGQNNNGQLGDGSTTSRFSPVTVVGGITNWSQISAGGSHGLGLTSSGTAYAWGYNQYGKLGDGTATNRSSPVTVVGGITNWSQVSAGISHSLGIANGIAYAWGYNLNGQLGDNTTSNRSSPVTVVGGITDWSQLSASASESYSLGLRSSGILYAWGQNSYGQLGDGLATSRSSPVTVVGGITNWKQVSAGGAHSLGLRSTGVAYAWGRNDVGQLGDNTTSSRSSPVTVVGGITNWSQVSAGVYHSLGLTSSGTVYSWGYNQYGQLGDGTIFANKSSPVTIFGGYTGWSQVAAGDSHSLGLTSTGVAYAWGYNYYGQLGDGTASSRSVPIRVAAQPTDGWTLISAGGGYSLGIKT